MVFFKEVRNFFDDNPKVFTCISYAFIALMVISWLIDLFKSKIPVKEIPEISFFVEISPILSKFLIGVYIAWEFFNKKYEKKEYNELKVKGDKYESLVSELTKNDIGIRKTCNQVLNQLFTKYKLDPSCRITLFYSRDLIRNPKSFYIMERYSNGGEQAHFEQNKKYSIENGVIQLIWQNSVFKDSDKCPEYKINGKAVKQKNSKKAYIEYQENNFSITSEDISRKKMKSCDFLGLRFSNENNIHIIILFESTKKGRLKSHNEISIKEFLEDSYIVEHLSSNIQFMVWLIENNQTYKGDDARTKSELMAEFNSKKGESR